jgi:hypothetical protein
VHCGLCQLLYELSGQAHLSQIKCTHNGRHILSLFSKGKMEEFVIFNSRMRIAYYYYLKGTLSDCMTNDQPLCYMNKKIVNTKNSNTCKVSRKMHFCYYSNLCFVALFINAPQNFLSLLFFTERIIIAYISV